MRKTLGNKVDSLIKSVAKDEYDEAHGKLTHNILGKMDGCNTGGTPDKNDWILDCDSQDLLDVLIQVALGLLSQLLN
jgi:hypothetical protein